MTDHAKNLRDIADDVLLPGDQRGIVRAAAARLAELEAIVAKLPHTIDGSPVTPGMTIFSPGGDEVIAARWQPQTPYRVLIKKDGKLDLTDYQVQLRCEHCYSTREAAEASKGTK